MILFCLLLIGAPQNSGSLEELAAWMTGSFSSQEQSQADQDFFDIRLEMFRIWDEDSDGVWFYVEQAAATHLQQPYRQRVYHLVALEDQRFSSEIFSLPEPEAFINAFQDKERFKSLKKEDLTIREGCKVILKKEGSSYVGGTNEKDCTSKLRGATYATTDIVVTETSLTSWDRGYNDQDKQVWGAEKAGYIFKKVK